jgi:3-phosphoshikimate 1-carboxyvinyltransferase
MIKLSHPTGILKGKIKLPASKSISNRALIIQELSGLVFKINNLSTADDTEILSRLIHSKDPELNCGDGGTTMRFILALLCLKGKDCLLTGNKRLLERPVKPLVDALNTLGASIDYVNQNGCPPLRIHPSSMHGGSITIDSSVSSQFISALMMIAPMLDEGLEINLIGKQVSKSYLKMTACLMKEFGIIVVIEEDKIIIPSVGYVAKDIAVEPDWSAASYWLQAAVFSTECDILLEGLSNKSLQGDAVAAELIKDFGVSCEATDKGLRIVKLQHKIPKSFSFDFSDIPDLIPAFAILCAALGIESTLSGAETLKSKESDRVDALCSIIRQAGGKATEMNGNIKIAPLPLKPGLEPFPVFNDHRMAMSIAPLALLSGEIFISHPEVVKKSYPGFWNDLKTAGFILNS